MKNTDNELDWVERLAETMVEHQLYKLEFETEHVSLTLRAARAKVATSADTPGQTDLEDSTPEMEEADVTLIRSKDVGLFRPSKELQTGAVITVNQKLGTIEAVSVEHDLVSEHGGILVEMLVQDGDPVEYGQPLLVLSGNEG